MIYKPDEFRYVNFLWDDATANLLDPVERLRYRSNILGSDQRITNTGGGNTSSKIMEKDPLTGKDVEVLWVKGSGGDLRTSTRSNFASLYMEKFLSLREIYNRAEPKGVKTPVEDAMVEMYRQCVFNLNPTASSIDTPLHGLLPFRHIDHTHPISAIAIASSQDQERLTHEVFGDEIGYTPWQRPGYDLALKMSEAVRQNPRLKGFIIGQHGLINWAEDDKACYELSISLIEQAARYIDLRRSKIHLAGAAAAPGDPDQAAAAFARHGIAGQPFCRHRAHHQPRTPVYQQFRRPAPGRNRRFDAGLFPAHENQALIYRLGPAKRFLREPAGEIRKRAGAVSQRLHCLLRDVQASQFAANARPQPDGDLDPRSGHDRLGQE
jgi:rhamnose utilization protein RhaD (predicted bifunctional aldolase and dehydrogenase)